MGLPKLDEVVGVIVNVEEAEDAAPVGHTIRDGVKTHELSRCP
jgi:hypothetical protein